MKTKTIRERVEDALDDIERSSGLGLFALADVYNALGGRLSRQIIRYHLAHIGRVEKREYGLYGLKKEGKANG